MPTVIASLLTLMPLLSSLMAAASVVNRLLMRYQFPSSFGFGFLLFSFSRVMFLPMGRISKLYLQEMVCYSTMDMGLFSLFFPAFWN
jgi:hypothetical protein